MAINPPTKGWPLQWPTDWPRTLPNRRSRSRYKTPPSKALEGLQGELRRLGARSVVISTNVPLRRDGTHYVEDTRLDDPGVAVYWTDYRVAGKPTSTPRVVACDRWQFVHENEHAIALAIKAMRAIDRSGASQILDRVFQAFGALPPASGVAVMRPWWEVLGFSEAALSVLSPGVVKARHRELAAKAHPDKNGGSDTEMIALNQALEQAIAHFDAQPGR